MKCDRSVQLDLAAFLAGEESPEVRQFRDHYPTCADCSAQVRAWMDLHVELDPPPAPEQHPSEELLLQFESHPERMSAVARTSVDTHLKTCASCRDELRTLRGFDFSILDQPAADQARSDFRDVPRKLAWWKGLFSTTRVVLAHPAFAYGLALLLLLPQLSTLSSDLRSYSPSDPHQIQEGPPAAAPPSQSEGSHKAAPMEQEGRDRAAVGRLADEERPRRMREMPGGIESFHGGPPSSAPRFAEERFSEQQPAHVLRKEKELDSLSARRALEAADSLEDKDAAESETRQGMEKTSPHRASSDEPAGEQRPARALTIEMEPSGQNNIPMQGMLGGATLRIKPQQPIGLGNDVAIRIKSADGRRELREIHTASREDGYLEMKVPPGWMPDGLYSLEVWPLDALPRKSRHRHDH